MTTEASSVVLATAQSVWESANTNGCAATSKTASNETATARRLRLPLRIRRSIGLGSITSQLRQGNRSSDFSLPWVERRGCNGKSKAGDVHVQIYCLRDSYTILLHGPANFSDSGTTLARSRSNAEPKRLITSALGPVLALDDCRSTHDPYRDWKSACP
jgi:hypothetical protein